MVDFNPSSETRGGHPTDNTNRRESSVHEPQTQGKQPSSPVHDPSTHRSLLERIRNNNDDTAWRQFVDLYDPLISRYCRRFGLQDADSQDVAQTVFRNLVQYIERFEYDSTRGRFRGWMGVVVTREIQRHQNKQARPGAGPGNGAHEPLLNNVAADVDPGWCDEFNTHVIEQAWLRLKPLYDKQTCTAFERSWLAGGDSQQVAEELGKPVAWVYKARFRVLRRLKAEVKMLCLEAPLLDGTAAGQGLHNSVTDIK